MKTPVELDGLAHDEGEMRRRVVHALISAGRNGEAVVFLERYPRMPGPNARLILTREYCDVRSYIGVVKVL
jgi:hypothetical protein